MEQGVSDKDEYLLNDLKQTLQTIRRPKEKINASNKNLMVRVAVTAMNKELDEPLTTELYTEDISPRDLIRLVMNEIDDRFDD